jgi:hypothetical protein
MSACNHHTLRFGLHHNTKIIQHHAILALSKIRMTMAENDHSLACLGRVQAIVLQYLREDHADLEKLLIENKEFREAFDKAKAAELASSVKAEPAAELARAVKAESADEADSTGHISSAAGSAFGSGAGGDCATFEDWRKRKQFLSPLEPNPKRKLKDRN